MKELFEKKMSHSFSINTLFILSKLRQQKKGTKSNFEKQSFIRYEI